MSQAVRKPVRRGGYGFYLFPKNGRYQDLRTRILVPRAWYRDLGTKILVPRSWYQDLGTKILVPGSWYQDLGTKISVPGSWYQDPGTKILVPTIFREKVKPITTPPDRFSDGLAHNRSKASVEKSQIGFVHINFSRSIFPYMSNIYENG